MFGDEDHWPFKCPNCGNVIQCLVGDMKATDEIACPACTHHFSYDPEAFLVALRKAQMAFDEFGNSIRPDTTKR